MNPIVVKCIIERKTETLGRTYPAPLRALEEGPAALRLFGLFRRPELDCGEVRDLASDYLDNEVGGSLRRRIAAHLGQCGLCQAFVDTLKATISLLGSFEPEKAPPSLQGYVHDRIRREAGS